MPETLSPEMGLAFSPEQESLRESVRRFLEKQWSRKELRATLEGSGEARNRLWRSMAGELGLQGIAIPEAYGGLGFGVMEQAVVLEEMGRVLLATPYLASAVVAAQALLRGDSEPLRGRLLPGIASGEAVATLALLEPGSDWRGAPAATLAHKDGGAWRVTGEKAFVVDGDQADCFIVSAKDAAGGNLLLAVARDDATVKVEPLPVIDATRPLARVRFLDAKAEVVAAEARAREVLDRTLEVACVALACEQMGGAAKSLETTNEYAKTRKQFGAPIGSFQAIKFKLADMLLNLEAGRSAAYYAAAAIAAARDDAPISASVAKAVCSDAYVAITGEMIQVHGGIAYTWEHDAHLYFKRARASLALFGDSDAHRERVAVLAGV